MWEFPLITMFRGLLSCFKRPQQRSCSCYIHGRYFLEYHPLRFFKTTKFGSNVIQLTAGRIATENHRIFYWVYIQSLSFSSNCSLFPLASEGHSHYNIRSYFTRYSSCLFSKREMGFPLTSSLALRQVLYCASY